MQKNIDNIQFMVFILRAHMNNMKKQKNTKGALNVRLGAAEYAKLTEAAQSVRMSRSDLARAIISDNAKRILDGEITVTKHTIISAP
jgi:uncharacterized protein (DUF1778 family)